MCSVGLVIFLPQASEAVAVGLYHQAWLTKVVLSFKIPIGLNPDGEHKKDGMQLMSSSGQSSFFLVSGASPAPPACPGKSLGGAGEGVPKMLPVVGSRLKTVQTQCVLAQARE